MRHLVIPGLGVGMLFPMVMTKVAEAYDSRIVGRMNALWQGIGSFGGSAGIFVCAVGLKATGTYIAAIDIIAGAAILGVILSVILNRTQIGFASRRSSGTGMAN